VQEQLVRDVQTASRQLCHRQLSWFRDERLFKWVEGDRPVGAVVDDIIADYEAPVNPGAAFRICMSAEKGDGHQQS
jgi:tRNA dimethylallyltransferase